MRRSRNSERRRIMPKPCHDDALIDAWERSVAIAPTVTAPQTNSIYDTPMPCFIGPASLSSRDPDPHARLESDRIPLGVQAQPQCIEIMIVNRALRLPGREAAERTHLGDDSRYRLA